jgi:hypothetical protein
VAKLRNIKRLENKENKHCEALAKQADKYKEIIPLAQLIWDLHISKSELISFKIVVNEAAGIYGLPRSSAAFHVLNSLKEYNRIGTPKKELSRLYLQKYALEEACARQSQALIDLAKMQNQRLQLNVH